MNRCNSFEGALGKDSSLRGLGLAMLDFVPYKPQLLQGYIQEIVQRMGKKNRGTINKHGP